MDKRYYVVFYVDYIYYLPHFLPIGRYLTENDKKVLYIFSDRQNDSLIKKIAEDEQLDYLLGGDSVYNVDAEFVFFANLFNEAKTLNAKKLFLWHGVGTKPYNFEKALKSNELLFTEGDYKYNRLSQQFPKHRSKIKKVGYSKLDPVLNIDQEELNVLKSKYSIDGNKKTILYAPTFYPSSIEKMADDFPAHFSDCNILIKPHYFTYEIKTYKNQRKKLEKWHRYDNCTVLPLDDYNLVPFLAIADIMISDESAAVFEFAALNKPVVLNRFLKLRWSYILNPRKLRNRLDQDMDRYRKIGSNAGSYNEMVQMVNENLQYPERFENKRFEMTEDICGVVDGNVSQRIFDVLAEYSCA